MLESCDAEPLGPEQMEGMTGTGWLRTLRPLPVLSLTPIKYDPIFLVPMGSSVPVFPEYDDGGVMYANSCPGKSMTLWQTLGYQCWSDYRGWG